MTELGPGTLGIRFGANDGLPLAVVAEAARLQYARDTDDGERPCQFAPRADRVPACRRNPQPLEQTFLRYPILTGGECGQRRTDARTVTARDAGEAGHRDVLPVEGDDLALPREPREQTAVGERAVQERRHAPGGRVRGRVQNQEVESERITRQGEHAAELAGAHDADRHVRGGVRGSGLPSTAGGLPLAERFERSGDRRVLVGEDGRGAKRCVGSASRADRRRSRPAPRRASARSTAASRVHRGTSSASARRAPAVWSLRRSCRAGGLRRRHRRSKPRVRARGCRRRIRTAGQGCGAPRRRAPRRGSRVGRTAPPPPASSPSRTTSP